MICCSSKRVWGRGYAQDELNKGFWIQGTRRCHLIKTTGSEMHEEPAKRKTKERWEEDWTSDVRGKQYIYDQVRSKYYSRNFTAAVAYDHTTFVLFKGSSEVHTWFLSWEVYQHFRLMPPSAQFKGEEKCFLGGTKQGATDFIRNFY